MLNAIAITQVGAGEFDKAIKTYQDAVKLLQNKISLAKLQFNLALAFKKKGDLMTCWHELANCYIGDPSFEKAYALLVKITQEFKAKNIKPPVEIVKKVKAAREQQKAVA
jgi:tetratricopeptide (TPR) repeat protein